MIDVSVIVVNWNTRGLLRDCLASTFAETPSLQMEVIVVDNGSSDDSVKMVKEEFKSAILIANADNRGFAAANNQGIAIAKGRYVLLLNSDTIVLDRAIEKAVAFADRHSDTAATGCRILNPDRSLQNSCFMFPSNLNWFLFSTYLYKLFPRSRFFGREQMTWWQRDDVREVDVVTGCFMLVSSKAIADVGSLDEQFFMYAEETDWCYRFKQKGWKNRFTPEAQIIHIGGASAARLGGQRAQVTNNSFARYMHKHWSRPQAIIGVGMLGFFYVSRLIVLAPRQLFFQDAGDKKLLENHWIGLKHLLGLGKYSAM